MRIAEFAAFWRAHEDILTSEVSYHEVAPQLVLMAWLQRIVNGGGQVEREAIELKVWRAGARDPLPDGLTQLDTYLGQVGLDTGTLVIFDRRPEALPFSERGQFTTEHSPAGRIITLLRA
jgi:hypothetical protein